MVRKTVDIREDCLRERAEGNPMPRHKKTFSCGHTGFGQMCHVCMQLERGHAARQARVLAQAQRAATDPIKLTDLPSPIAAKARTTAKIKTLKTQPLGTCDHCHGPIPRDEWYTSKGKPRLYCSLDCRNTANSRAGAPIRSAKSKRRVRMGLWKNPLSLELPVARVRGDAMREQAKAGAWRNPALTDAAREKLSRPRRHADNPLLHRAFELMRQGVKARDLPPDARAAHNAYQRARARERGDELRAKQRRWYHSRQAQLTDAEREQQRERWRAANQRNAARCRA